MVHADSQRHEDTTVEEYSTEAERDAGIEQMRQQGWRVQLVSHRPRGHRSVNLPGLAVVLDGTPERWVVEYRR
jgi:hypothetical protein